MKKLITILAVLAVMTASVPASALSAAAADTAPTAAEEAVDPAIAALAGVWEYQESPEGGEYDYQQKATVTVGTDGTFVYEPLTSSIVKIRDTVMFSDADGNDKPVTADNGTRNGTITIEYEEYPDGTKSPFFRFTTDDGATLFDCITDDQDENMLWIGNGGLIRMVRDDEESDELYKVGDFEGTWFYQTSATGEDDDFATTAKVTIDEDGKYTFTDTATGKVITGTTVIGYEEYDDFSIPVLLFMMDDGSDHFGAYIDSDDYLHIGNGGMIQMVRDDEDTEMEFEVSDFEGSWLYMVSATGEDGTFSAAARIEIDEDGAYTYTDADGSAVTGTVSLGTEQIDTDTAPLLIFTQDDGREQFTCYIDADYHLHIGNGGLIEVVRDDDTEEYDLDDFRGTWLFQFSETGDDDDFATTAEIRIAEEEGNAYTYTDTATGAVTAGTVDLTYVIEAGTVCPLLRFTKQDGSVQMDCYIDDIDTLHNGNGGLDRVIRKEEITVVYSDEDFSKMSIIDYESKTGGSAAAADVTHNADGTVSVVLKDAAGKTLDTYTLDAQTAKGTQTSDGGEVDLPQTGVTSAGSLLTALAALLMTVFGALAVRTSGVFSRRKDSK